MKFLLSITLLVVSLSVSQTTRALQHAVNSCTVDEICYRPTRVESLPAALTTQPIDNQTVLQSIDQAENTQRLPRKITSHGERVFIFSPRLLRWAAYDAHGYRVASGRANGGAAFCNDVGRPCLTPSGTYRIQRKGNADCVSSKFPLGRGGAPMPYCMFFKGGYAIHGSARITNGHTSHGCIRVHTAAAKWLHRYFMRSGPKVMVLPY